MWDNDKKEDKQTAMIRCRECGAEISDKARSCPVCGCPSEKEQKIQKTRDKNTGGTRALMIIIGIVLLIIAMAMSYEGGSELGRAMHSLAIM